MARGFELAPARKVFAAKRVNKALARLSSCMESEKLNRLLRRFYFRESAVSTALVEGLAPTHSRLASAGADHEVPADHERIAPLTRPRDAHRVRRHLPALRALSLNPFGHDDNLPISLPRRSRKTPIVSAFCQQAAALGWFRFGETVAKFEQHVSLSRQCFVSRHGKLLINHGARVHFEPFPDIAVPPVGMGVFPNFVAVRDRPLPRPEQTRWRPVVHDRHAVAAQFHC